MRSHPSIIGTVAVFLSGTFAQAQTSAPFTFFPAQSYDKNAGILVNVPGQKSKTVMSAVEFGGNTPVKVSEEKGQKAVGLSAEMGQFGWCGLDLGRKFEKGRYKVEFTLYASGDKAAAVSLYAGAGKDHLLISYPVGCAAGTTQTIEKFFFAGEPFSSLILKKADATKTPSVALVKVVLTDMNEREYPRLTGYKTLFGYPAPWGLRDPAIEAKTSKMEYIGEIESWLDRRSQAAELLGRADYLLLAHRLLKSSISKAEVEKGYSLVKNLQPDTLKSFEKTLNTFQTDLEKSLGATLDPANGTDIFTWVKSWGLNGAYAPREYSEQTPFRAAFGREVTIRLMKPGQKVDMTSSWTTTVYTGSDMTVTYSVLTPLCTIDLKTDILTADISGVKMFRQMPAAGWFALSSNDSLYLFVANRKIVKLECSDKKLLVGFNAPASIGYLTLPTRDDAKLESLADFYKGLLLHQPVQCVQVQKGNHIEQVFEYTDRPSDFATKAVKTAPVPHLVCVSLLPSSKLNVKFDQWIHYAPNDWAYVPDTDRIAYDMPKIPSAHTCGSSLWVDIATKEDYFNFTKLGCKTIRLVLRSNILWKDLPMDEKKKLVQRNLQWAHEAGGLTVGVDLHNEWGGDLNTPESFTSPTALKEFIDRWKIILSWCQPYRDVIGWYDLANEPQTFYERMSVKPYADFMRKAIKALRPYVGKTPILVECDNMANPVGLEFWEDLGDDNIIIGYHDYYPHMFTAQRGVDGGDPAMPAVFYPSFMPMIEWTSPSWRNGCPEWYYWDRWKCNSISLPIYRLLIEKGYRFDCGEYGIVGYAGQTSPLSSVILLRHMLERFKHLGINHTVWGIHGGFTWNIPQAREELLKFWAENK